MPGLLPDWPDGYNFSARLYALEQLVGQLTNVVSAAISGGAVSVDASTAGHVTVSVPNGNALTINAPSNAKKGRTVSFEIANASGGSMGTVTWDPAFKLDATGWSNPANGKKRTISFRHNGTSWVQLGPVSADI